jgi:dephospho-CoA kinase
MLKAGITGGIGSGKTTVCKLFEKMGVPVYYADDRARKLIQEDIDLKKAITEAFGKESYMDDGSYNRKYIADIVFSDPQKLALLNSIVHPAVFRDGAVWQAQNSNFPYTLKEAALLFESGSYLQLDKIIYVFAPTDIRTQRVSIRDELSISDVQKRMASQGNESEKMSRSDYIIHNDGTRSLIRQVWNLHQELLNQASKYADIS